MAKGDVFTQRMNHKFYDMRFDHTAEYRRGYQQALKDLLKAPSDPKSLRYGRQLNMEDIKDALKAMQEQDTHLL